MPKNALMVLSVLLITCWPSKPQDEVSKNRGFDATLWVQNAAEWRAHGYQAYNLAQDSLPRRLADENWTAALEQSADLKRSLKHPAVIVDIDETVLDNSPFQARLILDDASYTPENWKAWVDQAAASPVPGAFEFLTAAARMGVEIFYVTNRTADLEESTRKNLKRFGFPINDKLDTVLMKGEKPGWSSDKGSRRQLIAKTHRIIMIIGDDFGDFSSAAKTDSRTRREASQSYTHMWGRGWFILPNPTYGSWQKSVVDFRRGLSAKDKSTLELNALDPRRQ